VILVGKKISKAYSRISAGFQASYAWSLGEKAMNEGKNLSIQSYVGEEEKQAYASHR